MAIQYRCIALSNPPGPGIVVTVGVKIGAQTEQVFEVPTSKTDAANIGQVDPVPFAHKITRALLLGAAPASLIGVMDTE